MSFETDSQSLRRSREVAETSDGYEDAELAEIDIHQ